MGAGAQGQVGSTAGWQQLSKACEAAATSSCLQSVPIWCFFTALWVACLSISRFQWVYVTICCWGDYMFYLQFPKGLATVSAIALHLLAEYHTSLYTTHHCTITGQCDASSVGQWLTNLISWTRCMQQATIVCGGCCRMCAVWSCLFCRTCAMGLCVKASNCCLGIEFGWQQS